MELTSDPLTLAFGILYMVCGFTSIFGNTINILCYIINGKKITNVTNRFIVTIAVCDFLMGCTAVFCSLFYFIIGFEHIIGNILCNVQSIIFNVLIGINVVIMGLTGFNRYIYVAHKNVSISCIIFLFIIE